GCEALVKHNTPDKLQQRSVKCIFVGYPKETMSYYFYFPPENKIVVARSKRTHRALDRLCLNVEVEEHNLGDLNEPTNYNSSLSDPKFDKWLDAMNAKMQSMKDNQVWRLIDLSPDAKTIGSKWVFKKKIDMDGNVHTYKAHLVAKGYTQTYEIDYEETFSYVSDIRAIKILIAIAAFYDYVIWQMNVKISFLNGYLHEDVYMVQPEGFVDLKYPRLASGSNVTFLILYVDDILIMGNHIPMLQDVKPYLGKNTRDMYLVNGGNLKAELKVTCYCDAGFESDRDDIKSQDTSSLCTVPINIEPMKMYCNADNSGAIIIANKPRVQKGAKHYPRRYHYLRVCIELGEINLLKVHTDDNLSGPFTKVLPKGKLTQHARSIGLRPASSFM
ncbi:retrotransposon protein, putative, ty1-copia subclass, partial [Tanacetum coccineum]